MLIMSYKYQVTDDMEISEKKKERKEVFPMELNINMCSHSH